MNLTSRYLGLTLAHPFMVGASPLCDDLDTVKRLEDAGSSAIVLRSLFEEQITMAETGRIHEMDPQEAEFAAALAGFPREDWYAMSPDAYLEHIGRVKAAVGVPVIASLNGMTGENWLKFAAKVQQAGADALELNMYALATDPTQSSLSIETDIRDAVVELKRSVRIPIVVKLGPFFTALGHLARQLDAAGADGLVLFNRFYQPDIDIDTMTALPRLELSTSSELLLRLRWLAVLRRSVGCSLAETGGVSIPTDGIKAIIAGADVVQMVSAILRHGPTYLTTMREALLQWMAYKQYSSIDQIRGRVDVRSVNANLFERGSYIRTLNNDGN
jgi:dihydroorotate dehydrogenase (fumarate)